MPVIQTFAEVVNAAHQFDGYWYVATPYAKYQRGRFMAYAHAARVAGLLLTAGVPVFSPIAHSHPLAEAAQIPSTDHDFWLGLDRHFMAPAAGLIVACMDGWEESRGVREEIEFFTLARKPVLYLGVGGML